MKRRLPSICAALVMSAGLITPTHAQDIFNGGRFAGGSSDLYAQLFPAPGPPLPEFGGTVDLDRYQGTWYQLAAIPQPYTIMCLTDTTATYERIREDAVSVVNRCSTVFGPSIVDGSAEIRSDATLRVDFRGIPFQRPNRPGNYRITYLAPDYSMAIVGSPNRSSGFVLSRTPHISDEKWREVRQLIEQRGWWSCAFLTTPTINGRADTTPLCQLP
ncbi:lipocalin family protein [Corynebacterium sp. ES2775-CONJ]|uniref:lipocalin family protein n=1 Tax=Corynebacterium sp. ES2775-CONJ TaxID=2974029 RepID=UPI002167CB2E|nr:lipocalin family protein [Corynebacterium sp. ES2775-CONJ]MCS4490673.1 lipocalin family protein [Corynebacterium sp. ES2775-CONJ]